VRGNPPNKFKVDGVRAREGKWKGTFVKKDQKSGKQIPAAAHPGKNKSKKTRRTVKNTENLRRGQIQQSCAVEKNSGSGKKRNRRFRGGGLEHFPERGKMKAAEPHDYTTETKTSKLMDAKKERGIGERMNENGGKKEENCNDLVRKKGSPRKKKKKE